jgi:hypothetical protein
LFLIEMNLGDSFKKNSITIEIDVQRFSKPELYSILLMKIMRMILTH